MEKSQQTGPPDLRSWDADVLRWLLQKFLHRDCLPSVNAPPDTTMIASAEYINFRNGSQGGLVTGLELFSRGGYGWLYCWYGTGRVFPH